MPPSTYSRNHLPMMVFKHILKSFSHNILFSIILGLVKGLNEVCKALDRKEALLCVLAEDCADAKYKKLVTVRIYN